MRDRLASSLRWRRQSGATGAALALVLACGLLLGYYVLETYFVPQPRQYQLDFGDAQWIETAEPSPIGYFRKKLFLETAPEQAWLEVAATDNFKVLINGHTVGTKDSVKTRVAGIYDIKKRLRVGTNVIAVSISRTSFPGSAQLLVRGLIKQPGDRAIPLVSDGQWRVATETGIVQGSEPWTSPLVQDELWPRAIRTALPPGKVHLGWVDLDPLVLQLPPTGSWLLSGNAREEATFSTSVRASRSGQETWIQAASSGDLDLVINGHLITTSSEFSARTVRLPALPEEESTEDDNHQSRRQVERQATTRQAKSLEAFYAKETLRAYDISYWIKKGENSIVATVRANNRPASLFVTGFLVSLDGVRQFESSSSWRVTDRVGGRRTAKQPAVEVGGFGSAPWGYLPQDPGRPLDRLGFATVGKSCVVIALTAAAVMAFWLFFSALAARRRGELFRHTLVRDALFQTPITVALVFLLLPNYDLRFPDSWSFAPQWIVAATIGLLGVRLFHLFPVDRWGAQARSRAEDWAPPPFGTWAPYLLLIMIMALGLALRFHNLGYMSFDHDEMGVVTKSKGIYTLGIPYGTYAGDVRWITTYEAVPYPLALAGLFGYTEWTMRMPACIMGTLSIGLLALLGRRLFNWRTGLVAAAVYACLPLNIRWAQNAFYLQQCQFMSLLTIWLFYEAVRLGVLRPRFLTAALVSFCFTYLSWEGSAFLLPALFLGLMIMQWGEWWWLRELHLYRCLFFVGAVVIAQFCSRNLAGSPYLQVGSGLSNLTGPSLFFLSPSYQPLFYIDKLWLSENHVFFTLLALIGLPLSWSHRGFRYLFSILVSLWIFHTNFLAALSPRYCYYFQPLLVLSGVATAFILYDWVVRLARQEGDSPIARVCAHASSIALLLLLFVQSNEWLLKEYELSRTGNTPGLMTRMNTYRYDYRAADRYVKDHLRPGDVVFPGIPHVYAYYAGISGDYFLNTLLASKVPYNQLLPEPRFVDKFDGLPVVRSLRELEEVTSRAPRTWVVFAPFASFEKFSSPGVLDYLDKNARTVFESYRAKVYLIEGRSEIGNERSARRSAQIAE